MKIKDVIQAHFDGLSPQLKEAARFISNSPEKIATHSLRHIAELAELPPPTFSRLARALEFESYEELRDLCRQELTNRRISFAEKAASLQRYQQTNQPSGQGSFIMAQAASAITNIQNLIEEIDLEQLVTAANLMAKARKVYLIGFQGSEPILEYFEYIATMAFNNWSMLEVKPGAVSKQLVNMNENDVVLTLAITPFSQRAVKLTQAASETKARMIAITDSVHSPVCNTAEISFTVSSDSPTFFASYSAPLVLLESLIAMVVRRRGNATQKYIAEVEQLNFELGEYWPES